MKKIYFTILILTSFIISGAAQNIYIEEDFVSSSGMPEELIEAPNHIVNNSSSTVDFQWDRIIYDMPVNWTASFCDKNNCYAYFTTSALFTLAPGETGLLKPIFDPNEVEGVGTLAIRVYSVTSGVVFDDTATFEGIAQSSTGISSSTATSALSVYPTATTGTINIHCDNASVDFCTVYSLYGVPVSETHSISTTMKTNSIDVSELPAGVYFVAFFNKEKYMTGYKQFTKI